ncbi:hypothetical protein [Rhodococcus sp. X156]|uniref:hypothetical protein n=1 Tax=Rhodococcus sp. X156 TaxID=2499145 RepID=UPI000FDA722B|nr:hypothetical protein [Rhodococcus sp. X156]
MATFLTLGVPEPRAGDPLLARLLDDRAGRRLAGPLHAHPVVLASRLSRPGADGGAPAAGPVVVELDVDPAGLPEHTAVRYTLRPPPEQVPDALAVDLPSPRAVRVSVLTDVHRVEAAGHHPQLDADADPATVADFLAVLAHSPVGFIARADDAAGVLRVLAATVAALRGDDVRTAWRAPDAARVRAVPAPAAKALREVLLSVEVPDASRVAADLAEAGLEPLP